jgi:hypothetical protein
MGTIAPTASLEGEHPVKEGIANSAAAMIAAVRRSVLLDSFIVISVGLSPVSRGRPANVLT